MSQVTKLKAAKVYKNKKLNNANFVDFNHTDYQVFLHLISMIGGVDRFGNYLQPEQLQREHILTAQAFSQQFNLSLSHCYGILKRSVNKLMKTDIRVEMPDTNQVWQINVCSMAKYNDKEGSVIIKFTDDIMPYLAQVKQKFVLYNLKEIANFGSLYTTRLYELIQEFKQTGWMTKSVEQLREALAVGNKFTAYKDFKKYTFAHACDEINDNYDMGLKFEEIKEGRRVTAVKFTFKITETIKITDQITGNVKNIYVKPLAKDKEQVKQIRRKRAAQAGGKSLLAYMRDSDKKVKEIELLDMEGAIPMLSEAKPIGSALSSLMKNIKPSRD